MRRDQLNHAIRTACQIIDRAEVIVVGSQAILGSYPEDQLPAIATSSIEVDILPIADTDEETAALADAIEGVAGELSPFEDLHGFSIDGVDLSTSALPAGWRERLVEVKDAETLLPTASRCSPVGASTRTSVSLSCAPSVRRTATSFARSSRRGSSIAT
jgi:hypothetical protein